MAQFNRDLLDRTIEVPVEPWLERDFLRVLDKGEPFLTVHIDRKLAHSAIDASFSSIGLFQELTKHICLGVGLLQTEPAKRTIAGESILARAIREKTGDYASRHQRALEAIAAGHPSGGPKGDKTPLFLPYYLVRTILEHGFEGVANGAPRASIHEWIRSAHHRGTDVRASDMTDLLDGIAHLQSVKAISPPIFAYDTQLRMLQVVDSAQVLDSIQNPLDS